MPGWLSALKALNVVMIDLELLIFYGEYSPNSILKLCVAPVL